MALAPVRASRRWLFRRTPTIPTTTSSVTVTLSLDVTEFIEKSQRLAATTRAYVERCRRRDEVKAAGEWGRFYVLGGLDPAYAAEADRDDMVVSLLAHGRINAATAFLTGWATHRPAEWRHPEAPPAPPLVWHRAFGRTHVEVVAA